MSEAENDLNEIEATSKGLLERDEDHWESANVRVATFHALAFCGAVLAFCARRLYGIERLLAEQVQATRDAALPEIHVAILREDVRWRLVHANGLAHLYRNDDNRVLTKRVSAPMGYGAEISMVEAMVAEAIAAEKAAAK